MAVVSGVAVAVAGVLDGTFMHFWRLPVLTVGGMFLLPYHMTHLPGRPTRALVCAL
jgi:hypothetical protein